MNTNPAFLLRPTAWLLGAALATLSACTTLAPTYERPSAAAPAVFKEAPAADSTWFAAAPADTLDRGPWWQLFGDPILSKLVEQVEVSNQNVAAAVAAYAQAYFALREADNEIALLTAAVSAYERSLRITRNQYDAAIAQRTDVLQAQTQLETTRANLTAMVGHRA
jgi:outer membrane protein TolC